MYTSKTKINKDNNAEPTEFEDSVAQAFFDLENSKNTNQELKSELKDLHINSAIQVDVSGNKKAVVIHVPYRLRKGFCKIHVRLVRELEKKFSGKNVIVIATRRIARPPKKGSAVQRPCSRTLTEVHDATLKDLVVPAEIVGKRVRHHMDGSKIMKVYLDPKERNNTEYKLETFSAIYRKLAGKDVVFEYPVTQAYRCTYRCSASVLLQAIFSWCEFNVGSFGNLAFWFLFKCCHRFFRFCCSIRAAT